MKFLDNFRKDVKKMGGINLELVDPLFWVDTGNYVINKIISGKYKNGFAQGRIACLAGPSGAGKSFVASNVVKTCLDNNIGVLYIDTENAIDKSYFSAIGIDIEHPLLQYVDPIKISECTKIVSTFIKNYRESEEKHPFVIIIDSLDMLQTEGDAEKYEKGEIGGDQGQWAKQCKKMLQTFVADLKSVNIAMVCTKQVYVNQDPIGKYQEPWKFTDSLKFAFSQVCIVSKLLLKDSNPKAMSKFKGIVLQIYGFKTRFTKPFQKCAIDVPYDEGMDKYSGILEAAVSLGIVEKNGGWYTYKNNKFQESTGWNTYKEQVMQELLERGEDDIIDVTLDDAVEDMSGESREQTTKRRLEKTVEE